MVKITAEKRVKKLNLDKQLDLLTSIAYAWMLFCRFVPFALLLPIFLKNYSLRQNILKNMRV